MRPPAALLALLAACPGSAGASPVRAARAAIASPRSPLSWRLAADPRLAPLVRGARSLDPLRDDLSAVERLAERMPGGAERLREAFRPGADLDSLHADLAAAYGPEASAATADAETEARALLERAERTEASAEELEAAARRMDGLAVYGERPARLARSLRLAAQHPKAVALARRLLDEAGGADVPGAPPRDAAAGLLLDDWAERQAARGEARPGAWEAADMAGPSSPLDAEDLVGLLQRELRLHDPRSPRGRGASGVADSSDGRTRVAARAEGGKLRLYVVGLAPAHVEAFLGRLGHAVTHTASHRNYLVEPRADPAVARRFEGVEPAAHRLGERSALAPGIERSGRRYVAAQHRFMAGLAESLGGTYRVEATETGLALRDEDPSLPEPRLVAATDYPARDSETFTVRLDAREEALLGTLRRRLEAEGARPTLHYSAHGGYLHRDARLPEPERLDALAEADLMRRVEKAGRAFIPRQHRLVASLAALVAGPGAEVRRQDDAILVLPPYDEGPREPLLISAYPRPEDAVFHVSFRGDHDDLEAVLRDALERDGAVLSTTSQSHAGWTRLEVHLSRDDVP